jgi:hypothetical protein
MQTPQEKDLVRFDLSPEQRERIKRLTGRDSEALELTVEELEERIAPRLSSNHNETLLAQR